MKSQVIADATQIIDRIDWRSEVIGIDESNFMGPQLVEVAQKLADSGKQVIIAGLDTDYMGRPFVPMPDLLAHAESITKTLAICVRCGNPAKHTQRLRGSEDLIVVGASDMYEARCRAASSRGFPSRPNWNSSRPRGSKDRPPGRRRRYRPDIKEVCVRLSSLTSDTGGGTVSLGGSYGNHR